MCFSLLLYRSQYVHQLLLRNSSVFKKMKLAIVRDKANKVGGITSASNLMVRGTQFVKKNNFQVCTEPVSKFAIYFRKQKNMTAQQAC